MNIEVDYNPSPSNSYFISVSLNEKEAVSFDYTSKGHRITKQVLIDHKKMESDQKITDEWDALVIENRKFVRRYHVRWVDMDKRDWVNEEIWETTEVKPLPLEIKEKLLMYSQIISDNYEHLENIEKEMVDFEKILILEVNKFLFDQTSNKHTIE